MRCALIDRAATPASAGRVLLDQRSGLDDAPNKWLAAAAKALQDGGFGDRVTLEATSRVLDHEKQVLGYYSWGSNDPAQTSRRLDMEFVPGAIAGMFLSSDARTFNEPPPTWKPGNWQGGQIVLRGYAAVAHRGPDSRRCRRGRRPGRRAIPRQLDPAGHPVPRLPRRVQPCRGVLHGDARPQLADHHRRRPPVRPVRAGGGAGRRSRSGDRPADGAALGVFGASSPVERYQDVEPDGAAEGGAGAVAPGTGRLPGRAARRSRKRSVSTTA